MSAPTSRLCDFRHRDDLIDDSRQFEAGLAAFHLRRVADLLKATFIPFDMQRDIVPISATQIRIDPVNNWDYLSAAAKRDSLQRICVFGPESTGKTTLCQRLAEHFDTIYVPEYARLIIEAKKTIEEPDMLTIALGQKALEDSLAARANRFLFCDTDPLATSIWQRWLFKRENAAINDLAMQTQYDLYLLTEPDLPWVADSVRYFEGRGDEFFEDCVKTLEKYGKHYARIKGHKSARTSCAIEAINNHLDAL